MFIGPCISKKQEVEESDSVDIALTFEELHQWLEEEQVEIPSGAQEDEKFRARYFPITGGIIDSMDQQEAYRYVSVDGIEECREVLEQVAEGNLDGYFIEMSACSGSCIHGPAMRRHAGGKLAARAKVQAYGTDDKDYPVAQPAQIARDIQAEIQSVSMPGEKKSSGFWRKWGNRIPKKNSIAVHVDIPPAAIRQLRSILARRILKCVCPTCVTARNHCPTRLSIPRPTPLWQWTVI